MASEQKRGNREAKKPKKEVAKSNASKPSTKGNALATVQREKNK